MIKLASFINYADSGQYGYFCAGHLLVCLATSIQFLSSLLVTKYLHRDIFSQLDIFGQFAIGATLGTFITQMMYKDSDKFFTKVDKAAVKNLIIMGI